LPPEKQAGFTELVEAAGHGHNSSAPHAHQQQHASTQQQSTRNKQTRPHKQQQPQKPQQSQQPSTACRICDAQCHSSADLLAHVHGASHYKSERAFLRGMHAALEYLSLSITGAPAPPTAATVASASAAAAVSDVLTADGEVNAFYLAAANPSVRALCESLHGHEQGGAWRSFLDAVRAGMTVQQHWSSDFRMRQRLWHPAVDSFQAASDFHNVDAGGYDEADLDYEALGYDDEEDF
jgi:hypothetical protein